MTPPPDDHYWQGRVSAELRHVGESVAQLRREVHDMRLYVTERFEEHRRYHRATEALWGPARWCEQHPWRLAAAGMVAGAFMAAPSGADAWNFVVKIVESWLN